MDLTSGRWPRWVARYEKGGWVVHFRSDIGSGRYRNKAMGGAVILEGRHISEV